jgi:hypothetical protein
MRADSRRLLLSHSKRQRLLGEEMDFYIESMAQAFKARRLSLNNQPVTIAAATAA